MGGEMSLCLPRLYVGGLSSAKNKEKLDESNVTHVLSVHNMAKKYFDDKQYLLIDILDAADSNIRQHFSECVDFIHEARCNNGAVLVNCMAGCSRSVTVAVVYLMVAYDLSFREALGAVRARRLYANPNVGFVQQMRSFEQESLESERTRFKEKFTGRYPDQLKEEDLKFIEESLAKWQEHVSGGPNTLSTR